MNRKGYLECIRKIVGMYRGGIRIKNMRVKRIKRAGLGYGKEGLGIYWGKQLGLRENDGIKKPREKKKLPRGGSWGDEKTQSAI